MNGNTQEVFGDAPPFVLQAVETKNNRNKAVIISYIITKIEINQKS